jgi:uncharacterized membrane protein
MVNPFDLKTVFMAKHAQHVVLIHFPIALFIAAVAFDYFAAVDEEPYAGCRSVFQPTASGDFDGAGSSVRPGSVAVGA